MQLEVVNNKNVAAGGPRDATASKTELFVTVVCSHQPLIVSSKSLILSVTEFLDPPMTIEADNFLLNRLFNFNVSTGFLANFCFQLI